MQKLAAAYALGTLAGPARRRFESVMRSDPAAARAVAQWNRRLQPLAEQLPPREASAQLWQRIEQRAFGASTGAVDATERVGSADAAAAPRRATAKRRAEPTALRRWLNAKFTALWSPLPAGALATGLAFGMAFSLVLPGVLTRLQSDQITELPESYVGVLATAQGRTGLIVSSLRHGTVMDLKRVTDVPVPPGLGLYLWAIDAQGRPSPIGPVPQGAFVRVPLPSPAEQLFSKAVELGVSFEAPQTRPTAPTTPYAYRGLCGKLWRVPAPK
ncbi:MAG: hypothetical protein AD742_10970 [Methylibium sp. NZG]|nr:MAG: hypothetical protein AD742_10970 [Methylibium sp. NZG]